MVEYVYNGGLTGPPNLDVIHSDVALSTMENKNLQFCRWDGDTKNLKVYWDVILSGADEAKLDIIVGANI